MRRAAWRDMGPRFRDRHEAGRRLARDLAEYAGRDDVVVLGLPRGGVPVAFEIAGALGAPLDVFVVRKLGVPMQEELAFGAIASSGARVLNQDVVRALRISPDDIERISRAEAAEVARRERQYRGDRPFPDLEGRTVILVDDGLATGSSMRVAVMALRQAQPKAIVVAVPVAAPETCEAFRDITDDVICALTPEPFFAVGLWYDDFEQTSDDEVRDLLARAGSRSSNATPGRADASVRG
jgi:putative phosphoribosyl transferase